MGFFADYPFRRTSKSPKNHFCLCQPSLAVGIGSSGFGWATDLALPNPPYSHPRSLKISTFIHSISIGGYRGRGELNWNRECVGVRVWDRDVLIGPKMLSDSRKCLCLCLMLFSFFYSCPTELDHRHHTPVKWLNRIKNVLSRSAGTNFHLSYLGSLKSCSGSMNR